MYATYGETYVWLDTCNDHELSKNPNSPTCLFANSDIAIELLDSGYASYPYVAKL